MEDCAICLNPHIDTDSYVTSCKHRFHRSCISLWTNMSQTCPLCRCRIGHVSHQGINITDAQRERVKATYKLFDMTDNPDLSGIHTHIIERCTALLPFIKHARFSLNGDPVYLLLKGFRFNKINSEHGTTFTCQVDDENTRSQLNALLRITPDYTLKIHNSKHRPHSVIFLKSVQTSRYFRDGVALDPRETDIPNRGIMNAIVHPSGVTVHGQNILNLRIVQASFIAYQAPEDILSTINIS